MLTFSLIFKHRAIKAPKAFQRPKQVPQLTPHTSHSAKIPSSAPFQLQNEVAFEDLRFDRQVGNFKPSPKDKIYLDQLIGNYHTKVHKM